MAKPKRYQIVKREGNNALAFEVIDNNSSNINDVLFAGDSHDAAVAFMKSHNLDPKAESKGLTARLMRFIESLTEADATRSGPQWERFWGEYAKQLAQAMIDKPGDYMPGIDAATVAGRMKTAAANSGIGSINIHSEGFKRTCKVFGIKPTYKGIDAFFGGSTWTEARGLGEAKEGLRLPGSSEEPGTFIVLTPKKTEDGEFVVRVMVNGKNDEAKAYYTNDWDDAVATAKSMAESKLREDANFTYVWGVFKDGKGGFYANQYYSENVYPMMVEGNLTQEQAVALALRLGGAKCRTCGVNQVGHDGVYCGECLS